MSRRNHGVLVFLNMRQFINQAWARVVPDDPLSSPIWELLRKEGASLLVLIRFMCIHFRTKGTNTQRHNGIGHEQGRIK